LDAQADYYESTAWLTDDEKNRIDKLQAKKKANNVPSNRKYRMTLDIAGRKVYTQDDTDADDHAEKELGFDDEEEVEDDTRANVEENRSLQHNHHKAGEVYRLLKESLAPWRSEKDSKFEFGSKSNFSNSYMKQDENNLKNEKLATTLNATASSFQFKASGSGSSSDIFVPKKLPTLKQDKHTILQPKHSYNWISLDSYIQKHNNQASSLLNTTVQLVMKQDQPSGKLTEGVVEKILTNHDYHPRGLKVMLKNGVVGRVQKVRSN
jgi:uncharacterized repeat protein (TIGR03833 family)